MSKILTISVAAYNVEAYIKENIESIIAAKVKDDIEIFVVDDGGKDGTYEIAEGYKNLYPGIVHAVHKKMADMALFRITALLTQPASISRSLMVTTGWTPKG